MTKDIGIDPWSNVVGRFAQTQNFNIDETQFLTRANNSDLDINDKFEYLMKNI